MRGEEKRGDESRVDEIVVASDEAVERTSTRTVFSALTKAFNYQSDDLTTSSRGMLNKVAKELADVGATAWDIEQRMRNYAITYGKKPTPTALAKGFKAVLTVLRAVSLIPGFSTKGLTA